MYQILKINLFIYFWLCWVFVVVRGLLIAVAFLVVEHGLQVCGLQQLWHAGSRAQAQQLWRIGLVAPWHVGSSWTRDRTHVPCIGRRILSHCATREVPQIFCELGILNNHSCPYICRNRTQNSSWLFTSTQTGFLRMLKLIVAIPT